MGVLADTHVHIYECYDLNRFFGAAFRNLSVLIDELGGRWVLPGAGDGRASTPPIGAYLFLTERSNCDFFNRLRTGALRLEYDVEPIGETILRVGEPSGRTLNVVAGRQLATAERLEVLALNTAQTFPDGLSLADALHAVQSSDALPVVNWSLGKWMFSRRRIVEQVLERLTPESGVVGDVAGRPKGWGMPSLMAKVVARGVSVVAGSDPLPFPGEEEQVGTYGTSLEAVSSEASIEEVIAALRSGGSDARFVGRRNSPLRVGYRTLRNEISRRLPHPADAALSG